MFSLLGFLSKCFEVSWTLGVNVVLFTANGVRPYWTPANIFVFSLAASWVIYIWETYLSYRQYKICKKTVTIPSEVTAITDQETFSKARLYQLDKFKFGFLSGLWNQLETTLVLLLNGIPFFWSLCENWSKQVGLGNGELMVTSLFIVLGALLSTVLDLPWTIYYTFVIEQRHGFNNQTARFFAVDRLKKFVIMQCIMVPIVAAIVQIIKMGGDYFFVYLWFFTLTVSVLMSFIYSDFIAPLFDKFTALPEGELRTKIEALAASIHFPLKKLYVVEGSKRSSHSNAYFYGLYKEKKIVLFDTLLEKNTQSANGIAEEKEGQPKEHKKCGCNDEEILGILAHELGHWKLSHVLKNFAIGQVHLFFCFMIFAMLYQDARLYEAFGFYDTQPVFIGLILIFMYIFSPYNTLLEFLMTGLSRRFEFQADAFAKKLHRASYLRSALVKLNKDNLGFPVHDWLYSAWYHSHPPTLERIRVLGRADD
ncbi:CAAX prenyl protease 1 homolog [Ornithodoros turicata]|uniref:CAAX prenyl protease 1 homolog n=1 Tax=Ornithodoros turicata TaxID=34597 RepID=UPI003139DC48